MWTARGRSPSRGWLAGSGAGSAQRCGAARRRYPMPVRPDPDGHAGVRHAHRPTRAGQGRVVRPRPGRAGRSRASSYRPRPPTPTPGRRHDVGSVVEQAQARSPISALREARAGPGKSPSVIAHDSGGRAAGRPGGRGAGGVFGGDLDRRQGPVTRGKFPRQDRGTSVGSISSGLLGPGGPAVGRPVRSGPAWLAAISGRRRGFPFVGKGFLAGA